MNTGVRRGVRPTRSSSPLWIADDARIVGGGQLFAVRLVAAALQADPGRVVRVLCPSGSGLAERVEALGAPVTDLVFPAPRVSGVFAMAGTVPQLRRALREAGPDATWVCNSARTGALTWLADRRLRGGPQVVHLMHELESSQRASARAIYRRHGRVVAIGANAAAAYTRRLGHRVVQVNNFIDLEAIESLDASEHRSGGVAPRLGVLARIVPEKGILEFVAEIAVADRAWSEAFVAGGAQDVGYARQVNDAVSARGLGDRVTLLGQVSDPVSFLDSIDVLVVPSIGLEAQPTVILEALARGRPVVVREPIWSPDFRDLPVTAYRTPSDLPRALEQATNAPPADPSIVRERFGPAQALAGIERAAHAGPDL